MQNEINNKCKLNNEGKIKEALKLQLDTLALSNSLFIETNPIPIKEAMNIVGMNVGKYRLPLFEMEDNTREHLAKTMVDVGLF